MDVLRPPIVTIGGRCYRRNPVQQKYTSSRVDIEEEEEIRYAERDVEMDDDDMYDNDMNDDMTCDPVELEKTKTGYQLVMEVPSAFFGYIIGKKGETKKRIENETDTQIHVPRGGPEEITINGKNRQGVLSAKTRIEVLSTTARQKTQSTHLITFPINTDLVKDRFNTFKENVLTECGHCSGINENIFQNPAKLHLTVTTLVLMNKQEIKTAKDLLEDCLENIINPMLKGDPLLIDVAGLEYMNDDPGSVDVLYAKVRMQDGSNRLQEIANRVRDRFAATPLSQDKRTDWEVKLHATIMNSLFKARWEGLQDGKGRGHQRRDQHAFDASEVLEIFGDYFFGELRIESLHISTLTRLGEDGFYLPVSKVPLP